MITKTRLSLADLQRAFKRLARRTPAELRAIAVNVSQPAARREAARQAYLAHVAGVPLSFVTPQ